MAGREINEHGHGGHRLLRSARNRIKPLRRCDQFDEDVLYSKLTIGKGRNGAVIEGQEKSLGIRTTTELCTFTQTGHV